MKLGVFDLIGLAGSLIFAIPLANFGIWQLLDGRVLSGAALVGIAVGMVVIPQYFLDPKRVVGKLITSLLPGRSGSDESVSDASTQKE